MKLKKVILISIIVIVVILNAIVFSYAATSSELNKQQKNIDEQIKETETEIDNVHGKMTDTLNQINDLNAEISTYEGEIKDIQSKINNLNTEIGNKQTNIAEQEGKYAAQKELLEKRLVALYETGTVSYMDMLLSSESLTDFISKYYLIEQLAEADEQLLQKIDNTRKQIENEKTSLENSKEEVESSKKELEGKKSSLSSAVSQKKTVASNLSAEESELNEKLEEMEEDRKEIQSKLAAIAAQEAKKNSEKNNSSNSNKNDSNKPTQKPSDSTTTESDSSKEDNSNSSNNSTSNSGGYIFPVQGCSKANINKLVYPSYKGHTGVDVNRNVVGKNVVAVKSGTVVISTAKKNSNGTYRSYGEYVVVNHHDGTMTLYAHMLENSRKVVEGQEVSQGQVLGTVGSTGNSTGTHLHFEVLINGKPVNPIPYLP